MTAPKEYLAARKALLDAVIALTGQSEGLVLK